MGDPLALMRKRLLPKLRLRIERGWPRLEVGAMLAVTSLTGVLCSAVLLHLGVEGMGLRYALSVLVAYGAFFLQLRLWLARAARRSARGARGGDGSVLDGFADAPLPDRVPSWVGGGGRFAGGGASGGFELPAAGLTPATSPAAASAVEVAPPAGSGAGPSASGSDLGAVDLDVEGASIVVIGVLVALVLSSVVAAGYVLYTAPSLLAEVLFDGAVAGALYRRMRRGGEREWWHGALSRTWIPALLVLFVFAAGGLVLEWFVPGARSMGEALRRVAA